MRGKRAGGKSDNKRAADPGACTAGPSGATFCFERGHRAPPLYQLSNPMGMDLTFQISSAYC